MKRKLARVVFIDVLFALKEHHAGGLGAYMHYVLIIIICVDTASSARDVKAHLLLTEGSNYYIPT